MNYSEELQLVMLPHERKALDAYKAETGASFNFIFDKAIRWYIKNAPTENDKKNVANKSESKKRVLVRLTPETLSLLEDYCLKNNIKKSPTAVKATMSYILNSL